MPLNSLQLANTNLQTLTHTTLEARNEIRGAALTNGSRAASLAEHRSKNARPRPSFALTMRHSRLQWLPFRPVTYLCQCAKFPARPSFASVDQFEQRRGHQRGRNSHHDQDREQLDPN